MKSGMTRSEYTFLLYICQKGPMTAYTLGKETKYSEKTAYASTKSLVKKNLLTREVIDQTRAGLDKINYSLTLEGIITVFIYTASRPDLRPNIMLLWTHLAPLVLGKWDVLRAVNEKYAILRLSLASMLFIPFVFTSVFDKSPLVNTFYHHFYGVYGGMIEDSEQNIHLDWLKELIMKDSEIRVFVMNTLEQTKSQSAEWLRLLKEDSV